MCVKTCEQEVEIDRNRHLIKRKQEEHIQRERGCRQIKQGSSMNMDKSLTAEK